MAVSVDETESTYELPTGATLPSLAGLPQVAGTAPADEQVLDAEYFDTADLRLLRAGVTLRRRNGGSDAGWHLKLPAGPDGPAGPAIRREVRLPLAREGDPVPHELASQVRVHTRGEPLRPVARITTRRQLVRLLGHSGESLAEVAADDVSAQTMGESTTVSRWREAEVELTAGGPALLAAAGRELRRAGLRPAGQAIKLQRALGLQLDGPAHRPAPGPSSSAGEVVQAYLTGQAVTLKSLDPMVRRDEPDSVHQMRVATRRLRGTLRSFRQVIRQEDTAELAASLQWLGRLLGGARDGEVLAGRLLAELRRTPAELLLGPVEARVQGHFAAAAAGARSELLAALDSPRYFALLDELDRLVADPPLDPRAGEP
ncbi:MAG: CYTH and CHAD domain-containing protein, partial [Actinobacteria bacterium]|nr:CYTH and CHAD domain-containing protein [Actinomycetota bacterium]